MADMNSSAQDGTAGSPRSELIPASMVPSKATATTMMLQPGFSRLAPPAEGLDPKLLLKALRRRWLLATGLGFALAIVVGITAMVVMPPAKYTSRAQLHVRTFAPMVIFDTREKGSDYQTFKQTQIQMIKSSAVIGPALRDPKVMSLSVVKNEADPAEWLEKNLEVSFPQGSELLTVSLTNANPDVLEPIVNAVVTAYIERVVEYDHQTRITRLEQLRKLYNQYQDELRTKRASLRQLSGNIGTEDRATIALKQQFMQEALQNLRRDLMGIQSNLRKLAAAKVVGEKSDKQQAAANQTPSETATASTPKKEAAKPERLAPDPSVIESMIDNRLAGDPAALDLKRKIADAEGHVKRLTGLTRNSDDKALLAKKALLQGLRKQLKEHRAQVRDYILAAANQPDQAGGAPGGYAGVPGTGANIPTNAERLDDQIAMHKLNESDLLKEIEKQNLEVLKLNGTTIDLQNEQDDIIVLTDTAKKVGQEVEALDVELQAPPRITRFTDAESPRRKDIGKQYLMCGGAAFGAFALAMLGVSFWEMKAMRVGSVDEVVSHIGLSLVGTLPAIPSRTAKQSKADDQRWQGLLVESIDATRTMLLHASRVNATRAVMITSAMKGEGKTSLAAHLATSLARAGRKTLLIDCDLRRPRLHQLFDMPRVPGLCELLRGEAEVNDVIRPTPADDLNLMPAGTCDGVALQAIAQENFRDVLQMLKKRYDFIIVDSAPVLPVVDTLLLSQQVDAVLFSIMRDVSRIPHVRQAHERLESLGVKLLGAVVSAAERRDYMHMYDYEYQQIEAE